MLTVCITSYNTLPFLQLTVKSLRRHCRDWVKVWIWDNGSTDGSAEWAMANSDSFFSGSNIDHGHGGAMDIMGKAVQTDYVAFVDSDVEFRGDPFPGAIQHLQLYPDAFACDGGFFSIAHKPFVLPWSGERVIQMPRIDPCCAVLDSDDLKCLLNKGVSWKPTQMGEVWYDVGGKLLEAALANGLSLHESRSIKESVHHFGNSTWPANGCEDPEVLARVELNRKQVEQLLAQYEA